MTATTGAPSAAPPTPPSADTPPQPPGVVVDDTTLGWPLMNFGWLCGPTTFPVAKTPVVTEDGDD
jgi:hypothetical protein